MLFKEAIIKIFPSSASSVKMKVRSTHSTDKANPSEFPMTE